MHKGLSESEVVEGEHPYTVHFSLFFHYIALDGILCNPEGK